LKRLLKLSVKALLLSALLIVPISGAVLADDTIDIVVSPNVINLESKGGSVSVHTDIGYVNEGVATLEVNGASVYIDTCKDIYGNLVVKAAIDTIKDMVVVEEDAIFDLTYSIGNEKYTGTDTVKIIQVFTQKP